MSCLITLLDLSATLDMFDHSILLKRLEVIFGVRKGAVEWFASYLSDRCKYVVADGIVSAPSPLVYGEAQGSVLGPVLFTLYSQPLSGVISARGCNFHKYTDDTELSQCDEFCADRHSDMHK